MIGFSKLPILQDPDDGCGGPGMTFDEWYKDALARANGDPVILEGLARIKAEHDETIRMIRQLN